MLREPGRDQAHRQHGAYVVVSVSHEEFEGRVAFQHALRDRSAMEGSGRWRGTTYQAVLYASQPEMLCYSYIRQATRRSALELSEDLACEEVPTSPSPSRVQSVRVISLLANNKKA